MSDDGGIARARALLAAGRPREAAELLRILLAGEPSAPAWCLLSAAELRLEHPDEALEAAQRAAALAPEYEWPHRLISVARIRRGEIADGIRSARQAVGLGPGTAATHAQLAVALSGGGLRERRQAAAAANEALRLAPHDPEIRLMVGNAALKRHAHREAEEHFLHVLEMRPDHPAALNNLSLARLRRGRFVSAASGFGGAAAIDPAADLHRRNLDATLGRAMSIAFPALACVALLDRVDRMAGVVVLALPLAAVAYVARARTALNSATWSYLRRALLRDARRAVWAALIVLVFGLLVAVPAVAPATADSLSHAALWLSLPLAVITTGRLMRASFG